MLYSLRLLPHHQTGYSSLPHSEMLYLTRIQGITFPSYSSLPHSEMLYYMITVYRIDRCYSSLPHSEMLYCVNRKELRSDKPQLFSINFYEIKTVMFAEYSRFFLFLYFLQEEFSLRRTVGRLFEETERNL